MPQFKTIHFYTTKYVLNLTRALSQLFLQHFKILTSNITCDEILTPERVLQNRNNPTELLFILITQVTVTRGDALPDTNKYFIYQLEQLNDKTTCNGTLVKTEFNDLMQSLITNSIATFDYSEINMTYYPVQLQSKVRILPIPVYVCAHNVAPLPTPATYNPYKSDILFYGGMNPRREKILTHVIDALHRAHGYKVIVVNQVFGDELLKYILNTRVVLNLHYYTNSILETDRIHTALQFNHVKIVSEYPTQRDKLLPIYDASSRIFFCDEIGGDNNDNDNNNNNNNTTTRDLLTAACLSALSSPCAPATTGKPFIATLNYLCVDALRNHIF